MSESTDLTVSREFRPAPILQGAELEAHWRYAKVLAQSGFYKDARQAEQAFAKMVIGRALGLDPVQAMSGIHIIEGKAEVGAHLLAHFVKRRDGYDYRIVEHDTEHCSIEFYRDGELLGTSTFGAEDARRAKLDQKNNYLGYPRNMFFARAMSNGVKWFVPEVTNGLPLYSEGELVGGESEDVVGAAAQATPTASLAGVPLVDEVKETIERARALGHAGLSSVATAEMTLRGQAEERVRDWLNVAALELDKLEPDDAEVVPSSETETLPDPEGSEGTFGGPEDGEAAEEVHAAPEVEPVAEEAEPGGSAPADPVEERRTQAERDEEAHRENLLAKAEEMEAHAEVSDAAGDDERASEFRAEAQALRDAAEAQSGQAELDL